jgi:hypothetical protein
MLSFRDYIDYSSKYLRLAEEENARGKNTDWLTVPAIILAWSAIESFVNSRCDDLGSLPEDMFQLHERAFLEEKRLRFENSGANIGKFLIEGSEYQALENKIFFLLCKLGSKDATNLKGGSLWGRFQDFKGARDGLVHPRQFKDIDLDLSKVGGYIETAKEVIQTVSQRIWNKKVDF